MSLRRKLRGLLGTALTWGAVGATIGFGGFLFRFQPWAGGGHWQRTLTMLAAWEGASILWGAACGAAFSIALWLGERRGLRQLSALRITMWGALGGAAFPLIIYGTAMLRNGTAYLPLFAGIAGVSALLGAAWARASFALVRRLPDADDEPIAIGASQEIIDFGASPVSRTSTRVS